MPDSSVISLFWVNESKGLVGVVGREGHQPVHISVFWEERYRIVPSPLETKPPTKGKPLPGTAAGEAYAELFE